MVRDDPELRKIRAEMLKELARGERLRPELYLDRGVDELSVWKCACHLVAQQSQLKLSCMQYNPRR